MNILIVLCIIFGDQIKQIIDHVYLVSRCSLKTMFTGQYYLFFLDENCIMLV